MQRFVFDRDFDDELEGELVLASAPQIARITPAELEAARAEGYASGHAEGLSTGTAEAEARLQAGFEAEITTTLAALLPELTALREARAAHHQSLEQDLLRLTRALATALIPEIEARFGLRRMEAFCRQALRMAEGAAGLELHLPPATLAAIRSHLGPALTAKGAPVRLTPDESLAPGSASARWDQGRADFAQPKLHQDLLTTLSHFSPPATPDRS